MELRFVTAKNQDYAMLAQKLDEYYFELVGDVQFRYAEANHPKHFSCLIVVYEQDMPIACGCWKAVDKQTAEIKRIYVLPEYRRRGAASRIVTALEEDISKTGRRHVILETARTTPASAALYTSLGYQVVDYYGSPAGADNCLCFEKNL